MQALSGMDAAFLYLETPVNPLHVCSLLVCDPGKDGVSFEKLTQHLDRKTREMSVFRQRLIEMPFKLYYPLWVQDPDFDIVHHVKHVFLPQPGDRRALGAMVGRLAQGTLDRRYPLWDFTLIEGLEGGRIAIMGRMHHALADGVTGAGILASLMDLEPEPERGPMPPVPQADAIPSDAELLKFAAQELVKQPRKVRTLVRRTVERVQNLRRQSGKRAGGHEADLPPLIAPMTHLNKHVGPRRNLALSSIPLADVKSLKKATGTKLNDVVLAILGGALRLQLESVGDLPEEGMIAAVPMSIHNTGDHNDGTNQITFLRTPLGTDISDPLERIRAIHARTSAAKQDLSKLGTNLMQDWAEIISPQAYNVAVHLYNAKKFDVATAINLIVSNVPGPPFTLYMAGAKVEEIYPTGPVYEGCGLNITLFSYGDSIDFGLFADKDMVPDLWDLADRIPESLAQAKKSILSDQK